MLPAPARDGGLDVLQVPLQGAPALGAAPAAVVLARGEHPHSRSWRRVSRLIPRAAHASAVVTQTRWRVGVVVVSISPLPAVRGSA